LTFGRSTLGKVWASVSSYGLRAGLGYAGARWAQGRLSVPYDVARDYAWILNQDNPARLLAPKTGPLKINWLIPGLVGGSGGQLNIFRTINYLEQWGHKNRVYAVAKNTAVGAEARRLLRDFYFPIKAPIEILGGDVDNSDALVATEWTTAYAARALSNTAGKFYFVQDLEDRFYPDGSIAEFARETYRWHFHGLTLGYWIAKVLQDEFGMPCSPFGFSFDRGIYSWDGQKRGGRQNRVLFYARPASERRGFELGILALSLVAKQRPDVEFVLVGFRERSMRIPFRAVFPGVLRPSELANLYRSCEVALVLSHTNLSMLPLELMACGCAVVSNRGSNVEWLLTDEIAQLANSTPESLAEAILGFLNNEELRSRKVAAALAFAERTDWASETRLVEMGLFQGLKTADGSAGRPVDGAVFA
jgi:glycosyltransferase involved in cell wall biosynthesis